MKLTNSVVAVLLFFLSTFAFAACPAGPPLAVMADGRVSQPFTVDTSGKFLYFSGTPGHSYSVEVDDLNANSALQVFFDGPQPQNGCPTVDGANIRHTENMEPIAIGSVHRVSFTAVDNGGSGQSVYGITAQTTSGTTQATVSVSDTTLYSPRWSTFASFTTQWAFQNTTGQPIHATLTATATIGGAFIGTLNFTIPANSEVFKSIAANVQQLSPKPAVRAAATSDLNTDTSMAGFVVLTHDGPPGALLADAYFSNGALYVPATFQAMRALQH